MSNKNIDLIRQALGAAESSIKLAKQLLADLESGKGSSPGINNSSQKKAQVLPGISGIYDGENMVTESGEKFPVPENYSSKSMLVVGDTLKLVEEGKEKRFKQIEHVKRHKSTGILTKKDGKWRVITPEGSYKVLNVSVDHFGGKVGDEVVLHIPANNLTVPFGAIESVKSKQGENTEVPVEEQTKETSVEQKPTEVKSAPVEKTPVIKEPPKEKEVKEEIKAIVSEAPKPEVKKEDPKPQVSAAKSIPPKEEKPAALEKPKPDVKEKKVTEKVVEETPAPAAPAQKVEVPTPEPVQAAVAAPAPAKMEVSPEEEELT